MLRWIVLRPRVPLGVLVFLVSLLSCGWYTPAGSASGVTVYRCAGEDGSVEFRQHACEQGREQAVRVDVSSSGWVPPPVKRKKRAGKAGPKSAPARKNAQESKQKKECWRMRKRLEQVDWKMRRGYKAGKGAGLRRQRRDYEDYLRTFCHSS